jgi:hypothetical protein
MHRTAATSVGDLVGISIPASASILPLPVVLATAVYNDAFKYECFSTTFPTNIEITANVPALEKN